MLFIDALETEDELRAFCQLGGAAASVPKVRSRHCSAARALCDSKSPEPPLPVAVRQGTALVVCGLLCTCAHHKG